MTFDRQMEDLVHSLDGIVWEADPDTMRMRFVSRQAERLLGYPISQWLEEPAFWIDHLHPGDRDWALAFCTESTRDLRNHSFEYRMVAQDGRVVWLQDLVTVVSEGGKVTGLRGLMVDITRRKEAETRASAIQQRWGLHIEQTPLAIIEWNTEGKVISWNPAAEKIFGYLAAEAIGQSIQDLVVPKDPELRRQVGLIAESPVKEQSHSEVQHANIRKDGSLVLCQWFNTTLKDDQGRPIGVASMALDVTELHQATQALAESETRFRRLVELNPNAIIIQTGGRWRFANATTLALFGAANFEAFQARPVLEWIHPDHRDAARQRVQRVLSGEILPEQELTFLREDGSTFPAMVHGTLFNHQGVSSILGVIRDITQQKETDAAIEKARDSYRSLLMEMPFLVWKGTSDGGCEYINQAWMDFTGLDLDHLRGNQWAECVHPEDQPLLMQAYTTAMASLQPMAMEFRMRHQNGGYRWVKGQGKPFYGLDGRFEGFLAACNDIHDQRLAEAALMEKEQRFRTVADFTYDWEYWTSKDGGFLWMSPSCERITGYSSEAFIKDPGLMGRILHPDDRAMLEEHVHEVRDGGEPFPMDFRILHKDGRQIWISHICTSVFDAEGRPLGRRAANRDITARRQAEEDLFEASRQRLAMLEAASVARVVPWSMGSDGHMQWGDSANLVLGQTPTVLGNRRGWPWESIQAEDRPRLHQALREVDMGIVASFECRMRHGQGHPIWTRWTLAREQGSFHGAVQDITEQHAIQEQLLQSQKLESVGTLVGGISHDFNNLLGAILGYCDLFENDPDLNARHRKGLGVIQGAALRGRELVDQLLGFSRKVAPNRVKASLNAIVSEAGDLVARALPSGIQMSLDLAPDLPDTLLDPGQMHQVVMNLVINARDAIQGPGIISLRTGRSDIGPETALAHNRPPGPYVSLEVEDTGCGIPPDQLNRVFEPFYTTKGLKGTGLGLSVVYGLVTEHGGFMQCQSEVGRGTRFRVVLPLITAPQSQGVPH